MSYELLIGKGSLAGLRIQAALPRAILPEVWEVVLWAWEEIDANTEFKESYTKIVQGVSKAYEQFMRKLILAIQRQVGGKKTQQHLIRQLTFENGNDECQAILHTIKERDDVLEYVRIC